MEHEDGTLAPANDHLLAGLDLAEVEIDRAARRKGRRVGIHLSDERHEDRRRAHGDGGSGRDVEEIATRRGRVGARPE